MCCAAFALTACGGAGDSRGPSVGTSGPTPLNVIITPNTTTTSVTAAGGADTTAPTAPAGLTVLGSTANSISFAWQGSIDDTGVVAYEIWRDGVRIQVASGSKTTFTDTTLGAGTNYTYTVRAIDAAGNASPASVQLLTRTPASGQPQDNVAPNAPTGLTVTATSANSLTINWSPSADNVGVVRYDVYEGANLIGSTSQTRFSVTGLNAGATYSITVKAIDAALNESASSAILQSTTSAAAPAASPDTTAPSVPGGLVQTQVTSNTITLNWTASSDNVGVANYEVLRNGSVVGAVATPGYIFTGLTASTSYSLSVRAADAAGNKSAASTPLVVSTAANTPPPDTTPPSTPSGLSVSNPTTSSLTLSWSASTDNVAVTGYALYVNGTQAGTSTNTNFTFTGLSPSTAYSLTVRALDAAANQSTMSAASVGTTSSVVSGAPNIVSATGSLTPSSTLTITGTAFGVRASGTPFYFDDYETRTPGQTALAAGLDDLGYDGQGLPFVRNDRALSGSKSLRMDYAQNKDSMFPRLGKGGLSATEVYVSVWTWLEHVTGTKPYPVLKLVRGGTNPSYSGIPRFYETVRPNALGVIEGTDRGSVDSDGQTTYAQDVVKGQDTGGWHRSEYYFRLSTPGVADGAFQQWVDGIANVNLAATMNRKTGNASLINYIMSPFDGNDSYGLSDSYQLWMDDFYIDTTRARVEIGDSSTFSACTKRFIQSTTTWTNTGITVNSNIGNFTSGQHVYLYVVNKDGVVNANGYPLTVQ